MVPLQSNNSSITTIPHCSGIAQNNTTTPYNTVPYLIIRWVGLPSYPRDLQKAMYTTKTSARPDSVMAQRQLSPHINRYLAEL